MGVSLYMQSFIDKFPLKLIFPCLFCTLLCLCHIIANLKCTPIDNWIVDMCTNITTLWQFRVLSTFNCIFPSKKPFPNIYINTLKMCYNEKCQTITTFCLHCTMETPRTCGPCPSKINKWWLLKKMPLKINLKKKTNFFWIRNMSP